VLDVPFAKQSASRARIICLALLITGLWYSLVSVQRIDAWLITQRVANDLQTLRKTGQDASLTSITSTRRAAEKAVSLHSNNADIVMNAGLIWYFTGHLSDNRRDRRNALANAITHYERATELRPSWPHHYRNLHDLYYLTLKPADSRDQMLRQVEKYGKWSRDIKYYLLERTLARPRSLPEDLRSTETQLVKYLIASQSRISRKQLDTLQQRYPAAMNAAMLRATTE